MQRLLWPQPPTLNSPTRPDLSGTYAAHLSGGECTARLWFSPGGVLQGSLVVEGEELEISGGVWGHSGSAIGFLLEPSSKTPIGVLRARLAGDGMLLELDIPDFGELVNLCNLERIVLSRVEAPPAPEGGEE